jgi:hypothetical protein
MAAFFRALIAVPAKGGIVSALPLNGGAPLVIIRKSLKITK